MATTESFAQTLAAKQPRLLAAFKHIIAQNHLAHAYLFAGMERRWTTRTGPLDCATVVLPAY
ncbi:hypothetical protein ACT5GY_03150 [Lactiplantibacillus plantarum]